MTHPPDDLDIPDHLDRRRGIRWIQVEAGLIYGHDAGGKRKAAIRQLPDGRWRRQNRVAWTGHATDWETAGDFDTAEKAKRGGLWSE